MKILILFSGIGGMSRDWQSHNITYVELDSEIYNVGKSLFPKQEWINDDAIHYVENQDLSDFDVIFSTPPCTTHSLQNRFHKTKKVPDYTTLFGISAMLSYYYPNIPHIIENTSSMYSLKNFPQKVAKVGRHFIWSNCDIESAKFDTTDLARLSKNQLLRLYGFDDKLQLPGNKLRKRQIVRNILEPEIANYLLEQITKCINDKRVKAYIEEYF